METDSLQHCSTVSNMRMGLNSHSTFGAQGDQTNTKLSLLPARENPLDQQMTQHSEQLTKTFLSNPNINWDMETNYLNNNNNNNHNCVHLNDCILQSNTQSTKSSNHDEDNQQDHLNNSSSTNKQNFTNFSNTDLNGSKVIRLVRAKQATKRKSSLDTLIEVVQKELLRVNGQSNSSSPSSSPPPHHSQTRSTTNDIDISTNSSLNCQINPSRKRSNHQTINSVNKRIHRNRNHSFSTDDEHEQSIHHNNHTVVEENIDEIVRDTVDKLVAITLLNNAPFIVNMITGTNTNTDTKSVPTATTNGMSSKPIINNSDLALLSSTASELRNSMQQISPMKSPANASTTLTNDSTKSSTVFVTPRILNFQTVIPKSTTNIQIGNTKIILVSPTNSSSSSSMSSSSLTTNASPVKLVKLTPTLQKNVQIVIPSRTTNESHSTTIRPLTTCSIDHIPQAAQEVTVTTSPNFNKPRRRSSTTTPSDKPVGKILRPIAKVLPVYPPNNATDEIPKPMTVNFAPRVPSTHGPMIYRMTSVNPNVPVFRVRAPTTSTTVKTDTKSLSIAKQSQPSTTGASVSVVACFKTTKKRTKERAIMPRPTTTTAAATESLESSSSSSPHDLQSRLTSTNSVPLLITNSNSNEQVNHRPTMEDKSIQCLQDHENSTIDEQTTKNRKRNGQIDDDSWTVAADTLLRNVLSQYGFRFLDLSCQQNLSAKFDTIQANLVSGMISSKDDFYKSVVDIKENLLDSGLSKMSADNLEKLFLYFENEYPKISNGNFSTRTNDRKRTRRQ